MVGVVACGVGSMSEDAGDGFKLEGLVIILL